VLVRNGLRFAVAASAALLVLSGCGGSSNDSASSSGAAPASTPAAGAEASPSASPSATAAGLVIHIDLVGGKPKTRPDPIVKVTKGETITIIATADTYYKGTTPYEIHVHGFDYKIELTPGQTITKTFTANQPAGTYEVEIENTGSHLFNLQIR
jgi:hypothetical protein